jgi:hypothetical protein
MFISEHGEPLISLVCEQTTAYRDSARKSGQSAASNKPAESGPAERFSLPAIPVAV